MRLSTITSAGLLALTGVNGQLHELAVAAGKKYFGVAIDNSEFSDNAYVANLKNNKMFGQVTPSNGQKWQPTEPNRGQFTYGQGDQVANFAKANGQLLRCHALVWHNQLANWVTSGSWSKDQLTSIIQTHVANVAGHYKGQCYAWDVVNEALNEDGTNRNSVFYKVLGDSYIPIAFKAAAAADPNAKLYYNDYNIELTGGKQKGVLNIIKKIKDSGARIDGVGLQAHFTVGQTGSRSALSSVLKSFVSAGVSEVAYTELDIKQLSIPGNAAALEQQAKDYVSVVGACLDVAQCVGITLWGYSDNHTWLPKGDPLPWDRNLKPKPAYNSIHSLLQAAGKGVKLVSATSAPAAAATTSSVVVSVAKAAVSEPVPEESAPAMKPTVSASETSPASTLATSVRSKCAGDAGAEPAPSAPAGTAARWAQCGGTGFTGPTACQSGLTCVKQNDYYSQCV